MDGTDGFDIGYFGCFGYGIGLGEGWRVNTLLVSSSGKYLQWVRIEEDLLKSRVILSTIWVPSQPIAAFGFFAGWWAGVLMDM